MQQRGFWDIKLGLSVIGFSTRNDNFKLISFFDSDWAGCIDDRKSTTGFVLSLGSGAISWVTKKQHTTTLLSTEAERILVPVTVCHMIWLRRILCDFKEDKTEATWLLCDSKSTIAMTKNPVHQGRTKDIKIWHYFIREAVAKEEIETKFCNTKDQLANVFTKALPEEKFKKFRCMMGVQP